MNYSLKICKKISVWVQDESNMRANKYGWELLMYTLR